MLIPCQEGSCHEQDCPKILAHQILVDTMRRFHDREQLIQRIIQTAKPKSDGSFVVRLTAEDLSCLRKEAN